MFARFGHATFNGARWNEWENDSDSLKRKDFFSVVGSSKNTGVISTSQKGYNSLGTLSKVYLEVGG